MVYYLKINFLEKNVEKGTLYLDSVSNLYQEQLKNVRKATVNKFELAFETKEKEQKILELELKEQKQEKVLIEERNFKNTLIYISIALLLMIFTVVLALRKTKSQKNKIDILHRELHHRTKNNLAIISSFVKEAQQSSTSSKVSTDKLDSLQARITSIYEIHPLMSTLMV